MLLPESEQFKKFLLFLNISRGEIIIIGATNRPDAMDPAVRRAGRFDRELYFPPPDFDARREILQIQTKDWQPPLSVETLDKIARITTGYLG